MAKYESQSDVIRAIKKASDAELRALADISRLLSNRAGGGGGNGLRIVRASNAGNFRQPQKNGVGYVLEQAFNSHNGGTKRARNTPNYGAIPAQVSLSTVRKTRQSINKAVNSTMESVASAIVESIESDIKAQIGTKSAHRKTSKSSSTGAAMSGIPAGHYYDNAGRLRDSSGKYASKAANDAAKRRQSGGDDSKETNALLKNVLKGMAKGAANVATGEGRGDVTANAAGMGVMWQASKEMLNVVKGAGENTIKMAEFVNEGRKALKNKKPILRGFSANDARASVKENGKIEAETTRKEQHKDSSITHENQQKEIALLTQLVHKRGGAGGADGDSGGGGFLSSIGSMFGMGAGVGALKKLRDRFRKNKTPAVGEEVEGKAGKAGKVAGKVEKDATKAAGKVAEKEGEKGLEKLATGSLVKGGEGLLAKGGLKAAARIGMRAIPLVGTLASAAYDAYSGYNDEDALNSTFGKGPHGRAQRVSAAAANVADLGGLVSGTSNLISGVLDGLGFTSAAQVMQMNGSESLAREFNSWFGDADKSDDDRNESLLDKLTEIVTGIDKLTPAQQAVQATAQNLVNDIGAATAKPLQMATTTITNAKGEINQLRASKGLSVNPHAMITVGGKNASARGIAMNNPTNLDFRGQAGALGEVGSKDNHTFAAFATPEEGIRAAGNQLLRYKGQGITKLGDIMHKWAPPGENRTADYINSVAATLGPGMNANSEIDVSNPVVAQQLISAISSYENGSFNMTPADVQKSLGTVQNGKFAGGWTDATKAELSKTAAGRAILANNTGAGANAVSGAAAATPLSIDGKPMMTSAAVQNLAAGATAATAASGPGILAGGVGMVKNMFTGINNGVSALLPGVTYNASKAGMGLGAIHKAKMSQALNGDALVNASSKIALPVPATLATGGNGGIFSGALSDAFSSATQGINGHNIVGGLTKGLAPQWAQALTPLTNAAGNGVNSVLNLGREAVGGWINGSPSTQRSVSDMSASGARLSPDTSTVKAQQTQQTTLEEIASYLEQILGIQKKQPKGSADTTKPGPQPGPSGDIPLSSQSNVMSQIIKRGSR